MLLRSRDNDLNHISTIIKRSLDKLTGTRQVSIQEAVHEIAGLDLVICLDYLTVASLGQALYCQKYNFNWTHGEDLISTYRNRPPTEEHMILENYFYQIFSAKDFYVALATKREKH